MSGQRNAQRNLAALSGALVLGLLALVVSPALHAPLQASPNSTAQYDAEAPMAWFELQRVLIRDTWGFSPPVAARALGYTGLTLYEAAVPGMPEHQSLAGQLNGLDDLPQPEPGEDYHWAAVTNRALAEIVRLLFPTATPSSVAAMDALYDEYASHYRSESSAEVFERSEAYGVAIAEAIFDYSKDDGGHDGFKRNFPTDYVPPVGAGMWTSTLRQKAGPSPAMQPKWGNNRTFLPATESCEIPAPPAYSEASDSALYQDAFEVYVTVNNLTPEQRETARYWSDDPRRTSTPAGHSVSILTQVLREESATLDIAAEAYARLGIALNDAFIGCWRVKFVHNLLRPITYIHDVIDPAWQTVLTTPPFPEYPSGHSVQSGAAAQVLTDLFGDDYGFTDHAHGRQYAPRSFSSFQAFAEEAAISRLYGGIHYRAAIEQGLAQGRCIGERVSALKFRR